MDLSRFILLGTLGSLLVFSFIFLGYGCEEDEIYQCERIIADAKRGVEYYSDNEIKWTNIGDRMMFLGLYSREEAERRLDIIENNPIHRFWLSVKRATYVVVTYTVALIVCIVVFFFAAIRGFGELVRGV